MEGRISILRPAAGRLSLEGASCTLKLIVNSITLIISLLSLLYAPLTLEISLVRGGQSGQRGHPFPAPSRNLRMKKRRI